MSVSAYTVVRAILTDNINLDTDAVITEAKVRGADRSDADLRRIVHNTRSEMRERKGKAPAKKPAARSAYTLTREVLADDPSIATEVVITRLRSYGVTKKDSDLRDIIRHTRGRLRAKAATAVATVPVAKPIPVPSAATVTVPPAPAVAAATDPFAGVRLTNRTAQACGGIVKAREIAEAIRTVGGIDAFLERLALVADILGSETKM